MRPGSLTRPPRSRTPSCFYNYCPGESCRARGCPNRCRHPQCTGRYPRRVCTPVLPDGFWGSLAEESR